jgi:hypothetical protein
MAQHLQGFRQVKASHHQEIHSAAGNADLGPDKNQMPPLVGAGYRGSKKNATAERGYLVDMAGLFN